MLLGFAIVAVPIALSFACASILDIKDLPIAPPSAAEGGTGLVETGASDASDACAPRGPSFCQKQCPVPDFCEDFEGARLAEGWEPPFGVQNPLRSGEGNIFVALDDAGTQTRVLVAEARALTGNAVAQIIATTLDHAQRGRRLRGLRINADIRATEFAFAEDAGLGSEGVLTMLAFGSQALNQGVGISLFDAPNGEVRLVLQQRTLGGPGDKIELATVVQTKRNVVLLNTLPIEIFVAKPEVLREQSAGCTLLADAGEDAGGENDTRVLMRFDPKVPIKGRCAVFRGPLSDPSWLNSTVLFVGASVSDFGSAAVRIDNIVVTMFE